MASGQNQRLQICPYHKHGHCKHGDGCDKYHSKKICKDSKCEVMDCPDRHPQPCRFFSAGVCKFPTNCSYSHRKVEDMNSLRSEISSLNKKQLQAQKTITHQDKIIDVLKEQVNCLQAEVLNIMRLLADSEDTSKNEHEHEKKMDVDVTNTSEPLSSRADHEWDIDWDREEDLVYKEIIVFERDLAKRAKKEFQDLKKNLKTRSIVETKTKIGNLGVETKGKEKELLSWVEKNKYHKEDYECDRKLHTLFSQMDELMSCSELSTKTNLRKNVEAKIDTLIESCENVVLDKVGDLWGIYDESPKDYEK